MTYDDIKSGAMSSRDDEAKKAAPMREQMDRAREKWTDMQSRIRRRMRVYPKKLRSLMTSRAEQERNIDESELRLPAGGHGLHDPEAKPKHRPIVSIRGRDLKEHDRDKDDFEHPLAS
jgi:hypothetical protein